jgi:hypothetical protein
LGFTLPPRSDQAALVDIVEYVGMIAPLWPLGRRSAAFSFLSPGRRRGRQRDGQRITAQHHKSNEQPDRPLRVSAGTEKLGNVPDRCTRASSTAVCNESWAREAAHMRRQERRFPFG